MFRRDIQDHDKICRVFQAKSALVMILGSVWNRISFYTAANESRFEYMLIDRHELQSKNKSILWGNHDPVNTVDIFFLIVGRFDKFRPQYPTCTKRAQSTPMEIQL